MMISMDKKYVFKLWDFNAEPGSLQHLFTYIDSFPTTDCVFFFPLSCLIAEVQPDFQSHSTILTVDIHRSLPLMMGGMVMEDVLNGRDITSQRILIGNR